MPLSQLNRLVPHSTKENTHNKIHIILRVATAMLFFCFCFVFVFFPGCHCFVGKLHNPFSTSTYRTELDYKLKTTVHLLSVGMNKRCSFEFLCKNAKVRRAPDVTWKNIPQFRCRCYKNALPISIGKLLIMSGDRRNLSLDLTLHLELSLKVSNSDIYVGVVP